MRFSIVADINWETKVDYVLSVLSGDEPAESLLEYFYNRGYGDSVAAIGVVLMCRAPDLDFKQRITFTKENRTLSLDIMLDYKQMVQADHAMRRRMVAEAILSEVPRVIAKYRFKNFDGARFESDLQALVASRLLSESAGRRDHLVLERASGH